MTRALVSRENPVIAGSSHERLRRRVRSTILFCAVGLLSASNAVLAQSVPAVVSTHVHNRDPTAETVMKINSPFSVAAVGDIILPRPIISSDQRFQKLVDKIRNADVGFANMESSLIDFNTFQGPIFGTQAPFSAGEAIKSMGITIMSRANNHTFDGGVMGMFSTNDALDKLGIAHAGSGRNLQEARAAHFVDTPKGRVGLVGMFSIDDVTNYGPSYIRTAATYKNGNLGGAPGVNPLRLTVYHVVSPENLQALQSISRSAYAENESFVAPARDGVPARFRFFDKWFQAGSDPGSLHYEINQDDERDILASIRNGKVYADFMIATIHAHQSPRVRAPVVNGIPQPKEGLEHYPADFLIKLAHDCIDAGADMFVGHGPHTLHGVEIYKGKPIFYSVSNFVFQFGLQIGTSYDIMANEKAMGELENPVSNEAVLTTSRFDGGKLQEVRIYPVDLGGARRPISQMGIPMTPIPEEAQRILKGMQEYSKPFGTVMSIEDNVGVIRIGPDGHSIAKGR